MEKKTKVNDAIVIAVLLIIGVVSLIGMRIYQEMNTQGPVAVVTIGTEEYGRFPLDKDITERIELPNGSYNLLVIKDGVADITEATCPDGTCVAMPAISMQNQSIVCLPNEVVVQIENGEESGVDSVTN